MDGFQRPGSKPLSLYSPRPTIKSLTLCRDVLEPPLLAIVPSKRQVLTVSLCLPESAMLPPLRRMTHTAERVVNITAMALHDQIASITVGAIILSEPVFHPFAVLPVKTDRSPGQCSTAKSRYVSLDDNNRAVHDNKRRAECVCECK